MSKFIWKLQSTLYYYLRLTPVASFLLKNENNGINSFLKRVNNIQLETALDIGCGGGNSLQLMPKSIINILALDNCREMLKRTKKRFPDVEFLQADVLKFPFQDICLDLIFCIGVSEYVKNLMTVLTNFHEALKDEGYLIFTISPINFFSFLRYFWGHRIYLRKAEEVELLLRKVPFKIIDKKNTLIQVQYLLQK